MLYRNKELVLRRFVSGLPRQGNFQTHVLRVPEKKSFGKGETEKRGVERNWVPRYPYLTGTNYLSTLQQRSTYLPFIYLTMDQENGNNGWNYREFSKGVKGGYPVTCSHPFLPGGVVKSGTTEKSYWVDPVNPTWSLFTCRTKLRSGPVDNRYTLTGVTNEGALV